MKHETKDQGQWLEPWQPEELQSARDVILTAAKIKIMLDNNRQSERYHRLIHVLPLGNDRYSAAASLNVMCHTPVMIWRAFSAAVKGVFKELGGFAFTGFNLVAMFVYSFLCLCKAPVPLLRWMVSNSSGFHDVKEAVERCVISEMSEGIYRRQLHGRVSKAMRIQQGTDGSVNALIRSDIPLHLRDPLNELSSETLDEFNKLMAEIVDTINEEVPEGLGVAMSSHRVNPDGVHRKTTHTKEDLHAAKKFEKNDATPNNGKLRLNKDPE